MQKYVTPLPGRTPKVNYVTDNETYKLTVDLKQLKQNQYHLEISRWIPETGWTRTEFFLDPEELVRFQHAIEP